MQCYTEIVPPSGVTQALSVPFTSADANNLIVARTSLLQVFSLKQRPHGQDTKLVLVAEYSLSGVVTALGRVQIQDSKGGGDAILLAFRDAKLSLIEWDPAQHSISTISLHYYENYASQTAPWTPDLPHCVSHLTIDPNSRCAAFNFAIDNLAIVPFHHVGDDLAMDDVDDLNGEALSRVSTKQANGDSTEHTKPYSPSFVLPLTALEPNLLHPIDITFLHEYRDPTIGILYSTAARSHNMALERRDVTIYSVYALDIESRASTTLQSVHSLPNDIFAVLALPLPVGGALLVGGNELIHVDQAGKSSGVAVNEFAREASAFPMADNASLQLRLEGCRIQQLGNPTGDMLITLRTGELALLSFRLDGRSVSGMSLSRLDAGYTSGRINSSASCTATLGQGTLFIGSEHTDSVLLSLGKRSSQLKRSASRMQVTTNGHAAEDEEEDSEVDGSDDDDLYADIAAAAEKTSAAESSSSGISIRLLDKLPSVGPLHDVCLGKSLKRKRDDGDEGDKDIKRDRLDLAVACGRGRAGGIAFFTPSITPSDSKRIKRCNATSAWSFHDHTGQHVVLSETTDHGPIQSSLWTFGNGRLDRTEGTDFESSTGSTLAVCSLTKSNHTVHVTGTEIRVYDSDFGLSQIFPIVDEEEGQSARAVRASFVEPFIVLLKDDSNLTLLKADSKGELEECDLPESLNAGNFSSAWLYLDQQDFFQASRFQRSKSSDSNILLLLLTKDGMISLLPMASPKVQIFQAEGLAFLPTTLAANVPVPKHWRYKDELADAVLAQVGDDTEQTTYLLIRNTTGDITLYEPYSLPNVVGSFQFKKIETRNAEYNPDSSVDEDGETRAMLPPVQVLENVSGLFSVFVPGSSPRLVMKHASTSPRIYDVTDARSMCRLYSRSDSHGLLYVDDEGSLCTGQIPSHGLIGVSDWVIDKVDLHQDVVGVTYFEAAQSYVLAADYTTDFQLPNDDEWHPEWRKEDAGFLPTTLQSSLKLMSAKSHHILSEHHFSAAERILCIKTMNLEVSEETHERKDLIVVGTGLVKGENVVTRGNIYLFDVVDVVPQSGRPETDLKLKLLTREDVRGALTSICSIGSQGFMLAAQGQKTMVRGLREDMSILPVAFMDMRYYVHVAKSLASTGLTILGDAFSGLWLMGYSEDPYKMQLLGRDLDDPDCLAADFLPTGKELYIISANGDGQLRVLQYDPENPKSERGAKLLLRSTFDIGSSPTTMMLLPRTPTSYELANQPSTTSEDAMAIDAQAIPSQQLLLTTQEGSLAIIKPVPEATYRRLSTLQNILLTQLEHPCSLNPRAYRATETDGMGGRAMVDGDLVTRWLRLSSQHKASLADKVGARGVWELRSDLEMIMGTVGWGF